MGGLGSGSARRSTVATADEYFRLDIAALSGFPSLLVLLDAVRDGLPVAGDLEIEAQDDGSYRIWPWPGCRTGYGLGRGPTEVPRWLWMSGRSMFVPVTATTPHYAGTRLWFVCPRPSCGRRCRVLYREPRTNARAFACRQCYGGIPYASQRMTRSDRLAARANRRANRLVARLAPKAGTTNVFSKPKLMRWRTFERITREAERLDSIWLSASARQLGGLDKQWADLERVVQREARREMRRLAGARPPVSP